MSSAKSYAQETADRLRKEGNFKDADVDVNDVIQIIEDDEDYIQLLNKKITAKDGEIAKLQRRLKVAEEFAAEMKESANSLVRACGHQMILRLQGKGGAI